MHPAHGLIPSPYRQVSFYVLRFIELHRYCVFYKLKVYGSAALSKSIGAI